MVKVIISRLKFRCIVESYNGLALSPGHSQVFYISLNQDTMHVPSCIIIEQCTKLPLK